MPCRKTATFGGVSASSGVYKTEAECLQACKEGACCEGTTCTIKPQCQCQGAGKTFKGVGTTCQSTVCCTCINFGALPCSFAMPMEYEVEISGAPGSVGGFDVNGTHRMVFAGGTVNAISYRMSPDITDPVIGTSYVQMRWLCHSQNNTLKYYYTVSAVIGSSFVTVYPGPLTGGVPLGALLDATMPCQGQAVNTGVSGAPGPFSAQVRCVSNPLP